MKPPSILLRPLRLTWMAGIIVAAALLGSCGSSATTTLGPSIAKCATTSASPSGPLPADGGTSTLTVTALPECTWTASTKAPWIADLAPTSGQGNGQIQFKALANTAPNSRDGEVIINDQIVRVQQAAAACTFTVTPSVANIDPSGGTFRFVVTTLPGCSWSAGSAASWINVAGANERSGPTTLDLVIEPNAGDERSTTAVVAGQSIAVTQGAASVPAPTAPCTYAVTPSASTVGTDGGAVTISLQTQQGCQWTVSTGPPWLQLAGTSTGTGSTTISLVAAGNTGSERVSSVTIAGQVVTITQLGTASVPVCTFGISPGGATLSTPGATVVAVAVSAGSGCQWSTTNTTPWISIQSGSFGSGNGTVALAITDNTTVNVRSAVVTIAGQAFSISQAGLCSFTVGPTSASVPATGGAGPTITIATAGACGWSAATSAEWLTITSGSSGSGNGTLTFTAAANAGAPRSGTLTVAGQTVAVNQSGACGLSVAPATASAPATGATGQTVVVTGPTGCTWSATSNAAWLTITGGGSGSGNGTVVYSATANTGAARTGTLTVAGQTVTVNQAGGCAISLSPTSAALPSTAGAGPAIAVTTASTCSWTAEPDASWITVSSGANGSGNGTIEFSVPANTGPARSGAINVSGATFQVTQASGCTYSLAPSSQSIGAGGGAATPIAVTTTANCGWSASTNESWATITSGQSGSGDGTVSVTVLANTGPARSATLSIGNATATISQASGCVYTVSPTEFALSGDASTGLTISVSSGGACTWTAVTNDSWITITSTGTGRGDGTVRFNVSENTGGTRRGSLTVAGTVVEIRQTNR